MTVQLITFIIYLHSPAWVPSRHDTHQSAMLDVVDANLWGHCQSLIWKEEPPSSSKGRERHSNNNDDKDKDLVEMTCKGQQYCRSFEGPGNKNIKPGGERKEKDTSGPNTAEERPAKVDNIACPAKDQAIKISIQEENSGSCRRRSSCSDKWLLIMYKNVL